MNNPEIQEILKKLLGNNAYNNAGKVEPDFTKLIVCVDYLTLQMGITKRWCDEDGKEHIDSVIKKVKDILKNAESQTQ